jgi:hypothetical protein
VFLAGRHVNLSMMAWIHLPDDSLPLLPEIRTDHRYHVHRKNISSVTGLNKT